MARKLAAVVVLAAGQGKRMKSRLPKVLHPVCGLPMLLHVLEATRELPAEKRLVVVGHGHEQVTPFLPTGWDYVVQCEQLGTGHALLMAEQFVSEGAMLVTPGDVPLLDRQTLGQLWQCYVESGASAVVLTTLLDDPTGYGRIVRSPDGSVEKIVEHRDATADELKLNEVNTGIYVLPCEETFYLLKQLRPDNTQGELYLTDVIQLMAAQGKHVEAVVCSDPASVMGVNDRAELARAHALMGARIKQAWMRAGVTLRCPDTVDIDRTVRFGVDVTIEPHCVLRGETVVGDGSVLGPHTTLIDCEIGAECFLPCVYAEGVKFEPGTRCEPFTRFSGR